MLASPTLPETGPLNQMLLPSIFCVARSTWFPVLIYTWGGNDWKQQMPKVVSLDRAGNACLGLSWLTRLVVAGSWSSQEPRPWCLFLHCHPFLDHYLGKSVLFMSVVYEFYFAQNQLCPNQCPASHMLPSLVSLIALCAALEWKEKETTNGRSKAIKSNPRESRTLPGATTSRTRFWRRGIWVAWEPAVSVSLIAWIQCQSRTSAQTNWP